MKIRTYKTLVKEKVKFKKKISGDIGNRKLFLFMLLICFIAKFSKHYIPGNVESEAKKWVSQLHIPIMLPHLLGTDYFSFFC